MHESGMGKTVKPEIANAIGFHQDDPVVSDWRLLMAYAIATVAGLILLAF